MHSKAGRCVGQVCAKWCGETDSNCTPLKTFAIRLDSELVRNAHFIDSVKPGGCRLCDTGAGAIPDSEVAVCCAAERIIINLCSNLISAEWLMALRC